MTTSSIPLFLASAVLTVTINLCKSKQMKDKTYKQVLEQMFSPRKMVSRHKESGATSVQDIFEERKSFFQSVFQRSQIDETCRIIHVAGTKGKGSTVEFIASGLIDQANKVGIFTSPHLHTPRERIKYCRDLITKDELIRIGNIAIDLLQNFSWTVFFDILLTTSLLFYGEKKLDYLLLETGIGGRFDSTNFVDNPAACVITSISMDHQAILGNKLEEIAWQKAGIIKHNSMVFTPQTQKPEVLNVLREQAALQNATLIEVPVDKSFLSNIELPLNYDVEVENACLALAVLKHFNVSGAGMKNFFWPCRMEAFDFEQNNMILDGCHNGESVQMFLSEVRKKITNKTLHVVFGCGAEKSSDNMIKLVLQYGDKVTFVQSKHFKSLPEQTLLNCVPEAQRSKIEQFGASTSDESHEGTVYMRLNQVVADRSDKERVIVVCGSLFVAAEAREYLYGRLGPRYFSKSDWVCQMD